MSDKPDIIVVYRDGSGYWRWTRTDGNNMTDVVGSSSEGYTRKSDCLHNISTTQGGLYSIEYQ